MKTYANLRIECDHRGVARVALNRPDKHNALNDPLIEDLRAATAELAVDDSVRVIVLAAAGKMFCSGGDLGWLKDQTQKTGRQGIAETINLYHLLGELDRLGKPLIGRVHGDAFGSGVALMAVCDSVIAVDGAKFAFPETKIGLIPALISPFIVRRIGEGRARRFFMSGKVFDTRQALDMGLVSAISAGDLDQLVAAEVNDYLTCAPGAIADAKALCLRVAESPDIGEWAVGRLAERCETAEAREGLRCFFAGERPPWSKA